MIDIKMVEAKMENENTLMTKINLKNYSRVKILYLKKWMSVARRVRWVSLVECIFEETSSMGNHLNRIFHDWRAEKYLSFEIPRKMWTCPRMENYFQKCCKINIIYLEIFLDTFSLIAEVKKKKEMNAQRPLLPSRKINPFRKLPANEVTPTFVSSEPSTHGGASASQLIDYKEVSVLHNFSQSNLFL